VLGTINLILSNYLLKIEGNQVRINASREYKNFLISDNEIKTDINRKLKLKLNLENKNCKNINSPLILLMRLH